MVRLRLALKKGQATYSIVAVESKKRRDGACIEKLGYYNPKLPDENNQRLFVNVDSVVKFITNGAQPTQRVAKLVKKFATESGSQIPANIQAKLDVCAAYVEKSA